MSSILVYIRYEWQGVTWDELTCQRGSQYLHPRSEGPGDGGSRTRLRLPPREGSPCHRYNRPVLHRIRREQRESYGRGRSLGPRLARGDAGLGGAIDVDEELCKVDVHLEGCMWAFRG